ITFDMNQVVSPVLLSGVLALDKSVTISGPGAALLTISGNNNGAIFESHLASVVATISGLTLTNASSGSSGAVSNGGRAARTIDSCIISNNHASGVFAG